MDGRASKRCVLSIETLKTRLWRPQCASFPRSIFEMVGANSLPPALPPPVAIAPELVGSFRHLSQWKPTRSTTSRPRCPQKLDVVLPPCPPQQMEKPARRADVSGGASVADALSKLYIEKKHILTSDSWLLAQRLSRTGRGLCVHPRS